MLLLNAAPAFGYALTGHTWPVGSTIVLHLQLSRSIARLSDGSASWNDSAADALALWNQQLESVQFESAGGSGAQPQDGVNSVLFLNTVYGDSFGGALAVTLGFYNENHPEYYTECDVLVNSAIRFDSYRGPLRSDGKSYIYDLHRVVEHEFGHVLGLDHPDEAGQAQSAVMNSHASDVDTLTADDIAGAKALYAIPRITATLGLGFNYQITMGRESTNYSATGMPPGLSIDSATGLISGTPTLSGTYNFTVTSFSGNIMMRVPVELSVKALPLGGGGLLRTLDLKGQRFAVDPFRPRLYVTVASSNSVAVIDTEQLTTVKMVEVGAIPVGLAVAADGLKLWVSTSAGLRSAPQVGIAVVSLDDLALLPPIALPDPTMDIVEGVHQQLYASADGNVVQIDSVSGVVHSIGQGHYLAISPDRKTLYVCNLTFPSATLQKYDVSGQTPVLLQEENSQEFGTSILGVKLDHAGMLLCLPQITGATSTPVINAADISVPAGSFIAALPGGSVAFSGDDQVLYQSVDYWRRIEIFNVRTFALVGTIDLGSATTYFEHVLDLATDNTGSRLFVSVFGSNDSAVLVYDTGRTNASPQSLAPKSLVNVSTRVRVAHGDNALIGGFIVAGTEPKKVAIRALGSSLPFSEHLGDPVLEVHDSGGAAIAWNDNWNSNRLDVLNTGLAPTDEHEAAVVAILPPDSYTVVVRDVNNTEGVALVEVYDLESNHSQLANISTRGRVQTGDNVMIGGFIIGGDEPTKAIIRAIGPSLHNSGVEGVLADPVLELHDGNGALLSENDNWRTDQEEEIVGTRIPPIDDRESAIVQTLQPGNYTAIVRGAGDTTGVGLVEVYDLETN